MARMYKEGASKSSSAKTETADNALPVWSNDDCWNTYTVGDDTSWWDSLWNAAETAEGIIFDFPSGVFNGAYTYVEHKASQIWEDIKNFFSLQILSDLKALVQAILSDPIAFLKQFVEAIAQEFYEAYCVVENWFNSAEAASGGERWKYIGQIVGFVITIIVAEFTGVGAKIAQKLSGTFGKLMDSVTSKRSSVQLSDGTTVRMNGDNSKGGANPPRQRNHPRNRVTRAFHDKWKGKPMSSHSSTTTFLGKDNVLDRGLDMYEPGTVFHVVTTPDGHGAIGPSLGFKTTLGEAGEGLPRNGGHLACAMEMKIVGKMDDHAPAGTLAGTFRVNADGSLDIFSIKSNGINEYLYGNKNLSTAQAKQLTENVKELLPERQVHTSY